LQFLNDLGAQNKHYGLSEKKCLMISYGRFNRTRESDGLTDGQTDILQCLYCAMHSLVGLKYA